MTTSLPSQLLPLVQTLASLHSSRAMSNQATEQMNVLLRQHQRVLFRSFSSLTEQDRDDAIQHVLFKASTGSARCQAQHVGEAWSWCITVARHYCLGLLEDRAHTTSFDDHHTENLDPTDTGASEQELLRHHLQQLLGEAMDHLRTLPRGAEKENGIQCAVEHVFENVGIEEQIKAWGFPRGAPAAMTPHEHDKARNRIYAYRSRGIDYLLEALDDLEKQTEATREDTGFLRQLLMQRTRKKKAAVRTSPRGSLPPSQGSLP